MGRQNFSVEKALRIYKVNSDTEFVDILFGSGAPGGDAGEQDAAPIGSVYFQQNGTGSKIYQKLYNTAAASDWVAGSGSSGGGSFRGEKVRALTDENIAPGVRDLTATPFSDDEGTQLTAADFAVGEFVIVNAGAAPVLLEVTAVSAPNITLSTPDSNINPVLSEGDTLIVANYLPDSPDNQEKQSIVQYNGSIMVKVGDFNWDFADGINLNGAVVDRNGAILGTDTVQVSLEKHEGDIKDAHSALGISRGDVNFGSFTSPASLLLAASQTAKALFQRIGVLLAQLRGVKVTGITTTTVVDSVLHADVKCVKWLLEVFQEGTPANRKAYDILALTDGTTVDIKDSVLKLGANISGLAVNVVISGANMELQVTSTATVTATARRIEVVQSVL